MRIAKTLNLWAAVTIGPQSEWINHFTIRGLRRDAKAAYREFIGRERADAHIKAKRVKFVRVTVAMQEEQ